MNIQSIEQGKQSIRANLREICSELLEWDKTGILKDGISRKIAYEFFDDDLKFFELIVKSEAFIYIENLCHENK